MSTQNPEINLDPILRLPQVKAALGVGSTTVYKLARSGALAKPVRVSTKGVGWRTSDVKAYLDSLQAVELRPLLERGAA